MTPTRPDLDDLQDLSARLHDLAARWEVRPPEGRPDLAPTQSRVPAWIPDWLRGGMVPVLAGIVLVAVVVAASAWLSTLGTAPDPGPADRAPTEAAGDAPDTGTVVDLLDQVPAGVVGDAPVTITFGDVAAADDLAGVERPAVDDADAVATWLWAMSEGRTAGAGDEGAVLRLPMELNLTDVVGWDGELGWSLVDVDRFVDVAPRSTPLGVAPAPDGLAPGGRFTVVTGEAATVPVADGLSDVGGGIVRAGTPRTELADSTPARRQGGPLFLAERDAHRVAASGRVMVTAWQGDGRRLSADPELADVAARIAADAPITAVLARGFFAHDPAEGVPLEEGDLLTGPFDTVGLAWSRDDDGARMTAVYHHASPADAARTAQEVPDLWATGTGVMTGQRPLDELAEVESVETAGSDTIVVLRPRGGQEAQQVFSMLEFNDLPFRHAPGPAPGDEPTTAGDDTDALDDAAVLADEFAAEMAQVGVASTVDGVTNRPNGLGRDVGETLHEGFDLTRVDRAAGGGFLRVHASCVGDGTAAVVARATGTTNTIALRPSDPFPCDGTIHRVELQAPDEPVRVDLVAVTDDVTVVRSWLGVAELSGPTGASGVPPTIDDWVEDLREPGDPPTAVAGDDSFGLARHGAGAQLMAVQWHSNATLDGVFALRCAGAGTVSVANGDNSMAEELPCDGSTHRLDLVSATPPVAVAAHGGLTTTGLMVAILTDDELGDTDLTTG